MRKERRQLDAYPPAKPLEKGHPFLLHSFEFPGLAARGGHAFSRSRLLTAVTGALSVNMGLRGCARLNRAAWEEVNYNVCVCVKA